MAFPASPPSVSLDGGVSLLIAFDLHAAAETEEKPPPRFIQRADAVN